MFFSEHLSCILRTTVVWLESCAAVSELWISRASI